jgi:serine/threonine protein kinase
LVGVTNGHSSLDVVGQVIAGRYELEELTGSGGMSRVYRARDNQLGRLVAVKILHERLADDPEYVERFRREALAVARLNHPHIVTVIDRGEWDGVQYIVFEHVEGEDLKRVVQRTGPLPLRRAIELGIQIGRALSFAHANGVVHRDVKPQNVLMRDGNAKVTDFGIARADHLSFDAEDTETGTVLGTGDYISPEQARGERATEQSDVYSLGALLYEPRCGTRRTRRPTCWPRGPTRPSGSPPPSTARWRRTRTTASPRWTSSSTSWSPAGTSSRRRTRRGR